MIENLVEVTAQTIIGERFKDFKSIEKRLNETLLFTELELEVEFIEECSIGLEGQDYRLMLSVFSNKDEEFFADFDLWHLVDRAHNYYITGVDLFKTNKGVRN